MSNSLQSYELYSPWNFLGQNTGVGSCCLLQGIFPTQGSNPGLPHWDGFFISWATSKALLYGTGNYSQYLSITCQFSSVQLLSRVQLFATPWLAACQASLSNTNSLGSLRLNVHWVSDAIQPSHPPLSSSLPAPNPSQHQGLFQWVNSSHEVAKVLEFQPQHQSFQWTPRTDLL